MHLRFCPCMGSLLIVTPDIRLVPETMVDDGEVHKKARPPIVLRAQIDESYSCYLYKIDSN